MAFPGDEGNCAHFTDEGPEAQWVVSAALSKLDIGMACFYRQTAASATRVL